MAITIFVEVKARTSKSFGPPEVAVTPRKQAHMQACADHYAQQNEIDHWQIDVIAVERCNGQVEIMHLRMHCRRWGIRIRNLFAGRLSHDHRMTLDPHDHAQ